MSRATAVWTMLTGDEFAARYAAICPARGRAPCDVQLCELANPAKWDNHEWLRVLKELQLPAEHKLAMHRKAYEFTQTVWGLRRLGALTEQATVVSIGAGHEALLYWLANQVRFVLATDLYQGEWRSEGALEGDIRVLTQPEAFAPFPYRRQHLRFLQMDGTRLGVASEHFDVAYSLSSIEHFGGFAGARRAITEMARVVRPGGIVVVATECHVSGPPLDEVFASEEIHRLLDVPSLRLVEPIDDRVWRRYEAMPVDLAHNRFETPHMLVRIGDTVFTSVIAFLRKI
jgi:SAM-dependent methyltransferase